MEFVSSPIDNWPFVWPNFHIQSDWKERERWIFLIQERNLSYSFVNLTPPFNPLSKVPFPRPPARIWALMTNSLAMVFTREKHSLHRSTGEKNKRWISYLILLQRVWPLGDFPLLENVEHSIDYPGESFCFDIHANWSIGETREKTWRSRRIELDPQHYLVTRCTEKQWLTNRRVT